MSSAEKILVTGGLGFIGVPLVRALLRSGHDVRVLDNLSRGRMERLADLRGSIEIQEGDIRNAQAVERAAVGCTSVFHLAYINGTRYFYERPAEVLDVGIRGMLNVLDACRAHDVGQLFLCSSSEVYQTPPVYPTPENVPLVVPDVQNARYSYGGGKIASELLAIHFGRAYFDRTVIFRPHNVYGPDMGYEHVIPDLCLKIAEQTVDLGRREGRIALKGDGRQKRAFVYIDDFTDGLMRVFENGENLGIYHIGSDEEVTIRELAGKIAERMGVRIELDVGQAPAGEADRRVPSLARIRAFGYVVRVSLDEGLEPTVEWYRKNRPSRE